MQYGPKFLIGLCKSLKVFCIYGNYGFAERRMYQHGTTARRIPHLFRTSFLQEVWAQPKVICPRHSIGFQAFPLRVLDSHLVHDKGRTAPPRSTGGIIALAILLIRMQFDDQCLHKQRSWLRFHDTNACVYQRTIPNF